MCVAGSNRNWSSLCIDCTVSFLSFFDWLSLYWIMDDLGWVVFEHITSHASKMQAANTGLTFLSNTDRRSHQSVASPSLCLCHSSQWTFWVHFVIDSWFSVLSLCWVNVFFIRGFFLFDCFACRLNVTCMKGFTRYGHYTWGGRQKQLFFFKSLCKKIRAFSSRLMTLY